MLARRLRGARRPRCRAQGHPFVGLVALGLLGLLAIGCLSPRATHSTVLAYDRTVGQVEAELLLLNIARARYHKPLHFTSISSVAATFNFSVTGGVIGSAAIGAPGTASTIGPTLSGTLTENPTVTIVPVQGEEYTKRILTPLDETKFEFLLQQGLDLTMVLRLVARGVLIETPAGRSYFANNPVEGEAYREFRRRVAHLSALDRNRSLYVGPLIYREQWPLPPGRPPLPNELLQAAEKGYRFTKLSNSEEFVLSKQVVGRLAITNYDPASLPNEEIRKLNEHAKRYPPHHVLIDIRPGHPGGDYPLTGQLYLRSFNRILVFVADGIGEKPEYHVGYDKRTRAVLRDPPATLAIYETGRRPKDAIYSVEYQGRWFSLRRTRKPDDPLHDWDLQAFRVLNHIFQMTVTDLGKVPTPPITIAK